MPVFSLQSRQPQQGAVYFLDTNVWMYWLMCNLDVSHDEAIKREPLSYDYKYWVEELIRNKGHIAVCDLLFTELINAYLRQVAMRQYFYYEFIGNRSTMDIELFEKELRKKKFKNDYRDNPASDYLKKREELMNDLFSLSDFFVFEDLPQKLRPHPAEGWMQPGFEKMDLNDYAFLLLCKEKGYHFVTDDGDCLMDGVTVITGNSKFLRNSRKPPQAPR